MTAKSEFYDAYRAGMEYERARDSADPVANFDIWWQNYTPTTESDRTAFNAAIHVMTCHECKGKGGFSDTTYDRTGEWRTCGECLGYGKEFSKRAVYRLLGLEKVKPRD